VKRLRKFAGLSAENRKLLVKAAIVTSVFRVALWLLPFRVIGPLTRQSGARHKPRACRPERIAWAVEIVSRYVPAATCLVKALTTKVLFESAGIPARIHLGVSKTKDQGFEAHAWVESNGEAVIGGADLGRYTRLHSFLK
jgi:hypothetical protein